MHTLFIAVCGLWVASEFALLVIRHAGATSSRRDRGSLPLLIAGMTVAGVAAGRARGLAATAISGDWFLWAGIALMLAGMVIRWTAILTLRRYFTVNVAIQDGHELVDRGLYAAIRHPAYTGALLCVAGLGLTLGNWLSVAVLLVAGVAFLSYRIAVEERALREHFGERYTAYASRTKRLIPGVY